MLSPGLSHTGRTRVSDWPASARCLPTRSHQVPPDSPGPSRSRQMPPDPGRDQAAPQQTSSEASDKAHLWPHTGRSWRACACEGPSLHLSERGLSQSSSERSCRVSRSQFCMALATSRTQNLSRWCQNKSRAVLLSHTHISNQSSRLHRRTSRPCWTRGWASPHTHKDTMLGMLGRPPQVTSYSVK